MIPSPSLTDEAELTSHLRRMAATGASVSDLVGYLRRVLPGPDITFAVVLYLRRAFHLTLREVRPIEGSALLGNEVYTAEQTEELIRPLIDRNRDLWCRVD
jgi:hypothetical protein